MRLIDDWMLITADLAKANRFYDMVSAGMFAPFCYHVYDLDVTYLGHPEYGCFISKDKSLVNFDHPDLVNIVDPRSKGYGCLVTLIRTC